MELQLNRAAVDVPARHDHFLHELELHPPHGLILCDTEVGQHRVVAHIGSVRVAVDVQ